MKRALRYFPVAFFAIAAISWLSTSARWLMACITGTPITVDERLAAFNIAAAASVTAGWLAYIAVDHWRRARQRMRPVGTVDIVLRIDRSKFDRDMAAAREALR